MKGYEMLMNKVSSVVVNGNVHYIYCNGYKYSIDLGVLGENLTEPAYFASQHDAVWYFKRLLKWPISDPYRLVLETNDLGDLRQRLNRAREMWLEYELYSVDDGHDNLAEDMDIELGFYKVGTPLVDIEDDFERKTGMTKDYMLGWNDGPFVNLEMDFYTVNDDHTIELRGWMEERDNDWPGFEDDDMPRYTLVTGDWPDVYDPKCEMVNWACPYQQYNSDMHYEEALEFMRDYGGIYLPLSDVNEDTPAGDYWCYFDDEPARMEI